MAEPADPLLWITISGRDRMIGIFTLGSSRVERIPIDSAAVNAPLCGAEASLSTMAAKRLSDKLAEATGYFPDSLDRQRARIRELGADLRALHSDGTGLTAQLAELALARHVGEQFAEAAESLYAGRHHMADRIVAQIIAEVAGLADAMAYGQALTNPEERISGHMARIRQLRADLPQPAMPLPETENPCTS